MIGIHTRGLGHFKRSVPLNTPLHFFLGRIDNIVEGEVLKVKTSKGEFLMLFNNRRNYNEGYKSDIRRGLAKDSETSKIISNLENKYGGVLIFHTFDRSEQGVWQNYLPALLMPGKFNEEYSSFCESNKKLFSPIFNNYTSSDSPIARKFYALCNGSPNMFVWALNNFYKSVPHNLITDMLYWFENYNQFSGKLKKGSITSYNGIPAILKLQEELVALRQEKRISNVFNMFNTQQKKVLKSATLNKQEREMLSHFETLSKEKQINFIRKVSTLETKEEIFHQMALLTKVHFEWNRDSFLEFITNIENLSFDIVFDNNNIVILSVKDYDTIKYVTRTTNWCISKNKRYWDDYTSRDMHSKRKQYVLFDFNQKEDSELSIVGFTTRNDKEIIFAHSFTNINLMNNSREDYRPLVSFRKANCDGIINVLNGLSVPLENFMKCPEPPYTWERESIVKILSNIDESKYSIIKDEDGIFAFTIRSANDILNIIGYEQYTNMMRHGEYSPLENKHLFIFNFNKKSDDRILWTFVANNYDSIERTEGVFDANGNRYKKSLNWVLYSNQLPFDVFAKPIDNFLLLQEAINDFDLDMLSMLLAKSEVKQMLNEKKNILANEIYDVLMTSLFRNYSFDVLRLFYENGFKLSNLISCDSVDNILRMAMDIMIPRCAKTMKSIPTEKDYEELMNYQFNENKSLAYGMFYIIDMIWKNEKNPNILKKWYKKIHMCPKHLVNYYLDEFTPFINQIVVKEKIDYLVSVIIDCERFDIVENNQINDGFIKTLCNKLSDENPWKQKFVSKEKVTVNS